MASSWGQLPLTRERLPRKTPPWTRSSTSWRLPTDSFPENSISSSPQLTYLPSNRPRLQGVRGGRDKGSPFQSFPSWMLCLGPGAAAAPVTDFPAFFRVPFSSYQVISSIVSSLCSTSPVQVPVQFASCWALMHTIGNLEKKIWYYFPFTPILGEVSHVGRPVATSAQDPDSPGRKLSLILLPTQARTHFTFSTGCRLSVQQRAHTLPPAALFFSQLLPLSPLHVRAEFLEVAGYLSSVTSSHTSRHTSFQREPLSTLNQL